MNLTHPLRRADLVDCAKKELAYRENLLAPGSNITERDVEEMRQIVSALENYPLASTAEASVRLIVADLMQRKGFNELILTITNWNDTVNFWIELLKREVARPVVVEKPAPAPREVIEKLDFSDTETVDFA